MNPMSYEMLDSDNSVALLVDHQAGVKVTNWLSVACELPQDWAREREATGLLAICKQHLPQWSMLKLAHAGWKEQSA